MNILEGSRASQTVITSQTETVHQSLLAAEGTVALVAAVATSAGAEVDLDGTKTAEDDELSTRAPATCC